MENNALTVNDENSALIAEMVALRSGLSVISQKVDEIRKKRERINALECEIIDSYNQIVDCFNSLHNCLYLDDYKLNFLDNNTRNSYHNAIPNWVQNEKKSDTLYENWRERHKHLNFLAQKEKMKRLKEVLYTIQAKKEEVERKIKEMEEPAKPKDPGKKPSKGFIIYLGIVAVLFVLLLVAPSGFGIPVRFRGYFIAVPVSSIVLFILMIQNLKKYEKEYAAMQDYNLKIKKIKEEKEALRCSFSAYSWLYNQSIDEMKKFYSSIGITDFSITNCDTKLETFLNEFSTKRDNHEFYVLEDEMKEIAKECEIIEEGLHESFDSIIVENDWKNIDLIIFQMTSGRADSYKESLQLVDRLRQTEAIVNAVENASEAICSSLKNGFRNLGGLLTQSFERLSQNITSHIDSASASITAQIGQTATALTEMQSTNARLQSGMSELVGQNKALISATELNNALQEKANESSDRLYHDLRYTDFIIPRN